MLSTPRSECVKGFVTRVGSAIVSGDLRLQLSSLESPLRFAVVGSAPDNQEGDRNSHYASAGSVAMRQLAIVQKLIDECLTDIEALSDQKSKVLDAELLTTRLYTLHDKLGEMKYTLNGHKNVKPWYQDSLSPEVCTP